MVGDADTTVSPSSSSTSRSTPCVLGCCGPMLTVIVSVRSSGIVVSGSAIGIRCRRAPIRSTRRSRACSVRCTSCTRGVDLGRHVDVDVGRRADRRRRRRRSARPSSARATRAYCSAATHVRRRAAGGDAERDVARPAERFDLPREHAIEPVVVGDRRQRRSCRSSAPWPPARAARAETGRPARRRRAARPPRCRRCRTPAACRRRRKRRRHRIGRRHAPRR